MSYDVTFLSQIRIPKFIIQAQPWSTGIRDSVIYKQDKKAC